MALKIFEPTENDIFHNLSAWQGEGWWKNCVQFDYLDENMKTKALRIISAIKIGPKESKNGQA